jgi:hypothetical protein
MTINRTRTFRFLRIASSLVCVIACVMLIRIWVWSYYQPIRTRVLSQTIQSWQGMMTVNPRGVFVGSARRESGLVRLSYLSLVLAAGTLAALPWVTWHRRFRLRAFLIVTALIALFLGLVAVRY